MQVLQMRRICNFSVAVRIEKIYSLDNLTREDAMIQAVQEAESKAILAGANPETIQVVEKEEIPLGYLPGNA